MQRRSDEMTDFTSRDSEAVAECAESARQTSRQMHSMLSDTE